ncbi:unnamed protein product, partial [Owenia fusiformis]
KSMAAGNEEDFGGELKNSKLPPEDGDITVKKPQATQHELLIDEIESLEGHLSNTLRAVYDADDPHKFMDRLDLRIKHHDKEIERMCNYHYQGFIESIRELLQVRTDAERLKDEIQSLNSKLQSSGEEIVQKGEALIKGRKTQRNIASAIESLTMCLPVLETYGKLKEQMKTKRYYPALKTLEQLEHTYLPRVSKYRFSQIMSETIPHLRERIKDASMSDLKDFLENIRKYSARIGEVAMKQAAELNGLDPELARMKRKGPIKKSTKPKVIKVNEKPKIHRRLEKEPENPFDEPKAKDSKNPFDDDDNDSGNPFGDDDDDDDMNPFNDDLNPFADKMNPFADKTNPFADKTNPFAEENGLNGAEPAPEKVDSEEEYDEFEEEVIRISQMGYVTRQELSAQDMVDFAPVYRCLHIYQVLASKETFENYYRKQRRKQARLSLTPPPNMHETLEGYKKYFHDIIGFFVVEDHIMNTTSGLVNRAYMDELWDMALAKIIAVLRTHSAYCVDVSLMLQIKQLIVLFCHTLRGYGFTVSQLYDLLLEIRDQYNEILNKKWIEIFDEIFTEDNYTPIMVETLDEYTDILERYPFREHVPSAEQFPTQLPFSEMVPNVYEQVKHFIHSCIKFSEDLHLSHTEIDDMVRKSANILLTRTLSGCLSSLIRQNLTLLQLIQISINMNYLEKSCGCLEDFISEITGAEKDSIHVARLQGTMMFKDAKSEAEGQIYRIINTKIDEFLELANYDWMMAESKGRASGYLMDLIAYLQSTFLSFTNLPGKVAQTACMSACKHIAGQLVDFLMDAEVKAVSMGALQQLNLDLMQCEQFACSEPVPGFNDGTLQLAFQDLRQLLDLFTSWDWSTYLADYGQSSCKYIRVQPSTAIALLEKMKDADKKKNLFASLKKNERDKKKLLDTVLKQLRGLMNGAT